ncbi:MAG: response regulator [Phycisphaerales bacterium]|jgi:CheY-like chemotaxis protein|nr:response regulator [Phycisphaerales bacterium]
MPSLHLDRGEIARTTVAERLSVLERRIVSAVKQMLRFDHFEIRLLSPGSRRLELVISENISPLRIGESIIASETGNGISGWVAATGRSYRCADARRDPLYNEGLDDAGSSLTVPLLVHDQVVGVFNIESNSPDSFSEEDQRLAERFAIEIASALHTLDLLVVERATTCEQVSRSMSAELERPLSELRDLAASTRDPDLASRLNRIVTDMTNRVSACAAGPRSVIDAEHELHSIEQDPALAGRRVLVVDDEDRVRIEVSQVLEQLGCIVVSCESGTTAFRALAAAEAGDGFAMVVSDIRLPDATGYEVFTRTRQVLPEVPVVLMTGFGYDPEHTIVRASADGVQGILLKPFRTSQLIEAIRNALCITASDQPT